MKVELRKKDGQRITGDREGLTALRDLIDDVLQIGYGYQAGDKLPEILLLGDHGKPMLPPRPSRPSNGQADATDGAKTTKPAVAAP
jgi:hypothetical protein